MLPFIVLIIFVLENSFFSKYVFMSKYNGLKNKLIKSLSVSIFNILSINIITFGVFNYLKVSVGPEFIK
jgi:hypothetical protein